MKVKELIKELQAEDPEAIVVMSKDGEGNAFSPYADLADGNYAADSTWSGDFSSVTKLTPELEKQGYGEEDVLDGVPAVCLWPTN